MSVTPTALAFTHLSRYRQRQDPHAQEPQGLQGSPTEVAGGHGIREHQEWAWDSGEALNRKLIPSAPNSLSPDPQLPLLSPFTGSPRLSWSTNAHSITSYPEAASANKVLSTLIPLCMACRPTECMQKCACEYMCKFACLGVCTQACLCVCVCESVYIHAL